MCVWAATGSKSQPAAFELGVIAADDGDDGTLQGPREPPQSAVGVNSVDTSDEQLYSVIEDTAPATSRSDTLAAPAVYQLGSSGYYEGLQVTPLNADVQRSSAQSSYVYDKLSVRLRGITAETLLKRPYLTRASSVPVCRFPNTI